MKHVTCPHCKGSGRAPLSAILQATYDAIPKRAAVTAQDVFRALADPYINEPTAINNRLAALKDFGVVESERRGKLLFWRRTEAKS
jgi:hypothetical protein